MDLIPEELNNTIKGTRDKYAKALDPQKIIKVALKEGKRQSRKWPGELQDAPNCYKVSVSEEDWSTYYQHQTSDMEGKIAKQIYGNLRTRECSMRGYPKVTIESDPSLGTGAVSVSATFGPLTPVPTEITEEHAERHGILEGMVTRPLRYSEPWNGTGSETDEWDEEGIAYGIDPTLSFADAGDKPSYGKGNPADDLGDELDGDMPEQEDGPVARLSYPDGAFKVRPNMIIGVYRRPTAPTPDIILPKGDPGDENAPFRHVSQNHGEFLFEDGSWVFRDDSDKETDIAFPGSSSMHLKQGERAYICDGCQLILGRGQALLFEELDGEPE